MKVQNESNWPSLELLVKQNEQNQQQMLKLMDQNNLLIQQNNLLIQVNNEQSVQIQALLEEFDTDEPKHTSKSLDDD